MTKLNDRKAHTDDVFNLSQACVILLSLRHPSAYNFCVLWVLNVLASQFYKHIRLWFQRKVRISVLDFHCASVAFQTMITSPQEISEKKKKWYSEIDSKRLLPDYRMGHYFQSTSQNFLKKTCEAETWTSIKYMELETRVALSHVPAGRIFLPTLEFALKMNSSNFREKLNCLNAAFILGRICQHGRRGDEVICEEIFTTEAYTFKEKEDLKCEGPGRNGMCMR